MRTLARQNPRRPWLFDAPLSYEAFEIIKGFPGVLWDRHSKKTSIPEELLKSCEAALQTKGFHLTHVPATPTLVPVIADHLHDYQQMGVARALKLNRWVFNDDTGVGKTIQAIETLRHLGAKKILIVCPALVRRSWEKELDSWWANHPEAGAILYGRARVKGLSKAKVAQKEQSYRAAIQISSYELLKNLAETTYDAVIFDEAHRVKNPKSQQAKLGKKIARKAKYVFALTATAMADRPPDIYNILDIVYPLRFGRPNEGLGYCFDFNYRYSVGIHNGYGWDFKGVNRANREELAYRIAACSSRTTKAEIAHLLPAFDIQPLVVQGGKRLDHVTEWAKDALESTDMLCILTHLKDTAGTIAEKLSKQYPNHTVALVTGTTYSDAYKRAQFLEELVQEPKVILVATMHAVCEGIDLTAFTQTLFAELYYAPRIVVQALGRFSRLCGKVPSLVKMLIREGTPDERVASILQEKIEAINETIKASGTEQKMEELLLATAETDEEFLANFGKQEPEYANLSGRLE